MKAYQFNHTMDWLACVLQKRVRYSQSYICNSKPMIQRLNDRSGEGNITSPERQATATVTCYKQVSCCGRSFFCAFLRLFFAFNYGISPNPSTLQMFQIALE